MSETKTIDAIVAELQALENGVQDLPQLIADLQALAGTATTPVTVASANVVMSDGSTVALVLPPAQA